jgi:hypothetical protein
VLLTKQYVVPPRNAQWCSALHIQHTYFSVTLPARCEPVCVATCQLSRCTRSCASTIDVSASLLCFNDQCRGATTGYVALVVSALDRLAGESILQSPLHILHVATGTHSCIERESIETQIRVDVIIWVCHQTCMPWTQHRSRTNTVSPGHDTIAGWKSKASQSSNSNKVKMCRARTVVNT